MSAFHSLHLIAHAIPDIEMKWIGEGEEGLTRDLDVEIKLLHG